MHDAFGAIPHTYFDEYFGFEPVDDLMMAALLKIRLT